MGFFSKLFRDRDPDQPAEAGEATGAEGEAGASADPVQDGEPEPEPIEPPAPPSDAVSSRPRADTLRASTAAATPPPPPSPTPAATASPPEPIVQKRRTIKEPRPAVPTPVTRASTEPMTTVLSAPAPASTAAVAPPPVPATPSVVARADSGRIPIPPPPRPASKTTAAPARPATADTRPPTSEPAAARPTASAPAKTTAAESGKRGRRDSTADLFAEIDTAIDGAQEADGVASREGELEPDVAATAEMQRLFGEIAAHHAGHLRDFVIELSLSPTGKAWLEACAPAVEALELAAAKIQHRALVEALVRFREVCKAAQGSPRTNIEGEPRQAILASYEALRELLPGAFDVAAQRDRREPIVLSALIAQVPGITSLDVHRIYGAGAMSLSTLVRAGAGELSSVTGIPRERCAAILARVSAYHRQRTEHPAAGDGRERLRGLLEALRRCEENFREAEEAEDRARKRELRRERLQLAKQVELELTDLGNLDLVADLRRESTERKIARVDRWLREPALAPMSASAPQ
jgi:hypothetical protein